MSDIDTLDIAERLNRVRYKVGVVGSVIKDHEADYDETTGAGFLIIEIRDELEAIGEAIHPRPDKEAEREPAS